VTAVESAEPVLVPIGGIRQKLDNDSPNYIFSPDTYLTLALAYDNMAGPAAAPDATGVLQQDFTRMQPRMATGWTEQPGGDWVVRLRPGMRSHAGHEWTAADLAWVFDKAFAEGVMARWRWKEVVGVQRVEVLDRHTVTFRLRSPYPTFPNWLMSVSPNMVDSVAVRAASTDADPWGVAWLDGHVAGYGPYRLDEMNAEQLSFSARADYWAGPPEAARVEVAKFGSRADAIAQLRENRPVVIVGTDPDESTALLAAGDLSVVRAWGGHVSVEIDFASAPFDDARVRLALALATPSEQIRSAGLLGLARPWRGPVKGVSQWQSRSPVSQPHDPGRARELLAAAGYSGGLTSDFYLERTPHSERIAQLIADSWKEIGVDLVRRDIAAAPEGWLPPLSLRTECGHNLSEPIYDIAHDYAAMTPLLPLPGGPPNVGNWHPRWKKNPAVLEKFGAMLELGDGPAKQRACEELQGFIADFGSSIGIAEMQQTIVANRYVPPSMVAPGSRFFQALAYQNPQSNYLPARHAPGPS
jgi:ABC-type transport system substrate-binding protein